MYLDDRGRKQKGVKVKKVAKIAAVKYISKKYDVIPKIWESGVFSALMVGPIQ